MVTLHLSDYEVKHDKLTDHHWSPLLLDQEDIICVLIELILLLFGWLSKGWVDVSHRHAELSSSLNVMEVSFVPHNEALDPRALFKRVSVLLLVSHLSRELSKIVPIEPVNIVEVMLVEKLRYSLSLVQVSKVHHSVAIRISCLPFDLID